MTVDSPGLVDELPVLQRLALAYAPAAVRTPTLALLAFDTRLAGIVRASHEPMLAQLRLAWWREQLLAADPGWSSGDPLLRILHSWQGRLPALVALVDGWEAMTGDAPLPAEPLLALAQGRGAAFAGLAELAGVPEHGAAAAELGTSWALADLAVRLSHPDERELARALAAERVSPRRALPRRLRPLAVLHGLARRSLRSEAAHRPAATLLAALRIGLLGR